jgi:predicted dehydrogenase
VRELAGWRADPHHAGLGAVNNIGVHLYDVLRFILDVEVVEVAAMFGTDGPGNLETLVLATLRFADGTLAYTNCNQNSPFPQNRIDIYGSEGRVSAIGVTREDQGSVTVCTSAGEETRMSFDSDESWDRLVAAFEDAIVSGRTPSPSGIDGLRSVELSQAIATSAREKRVIEIPN